MTLSSNQPYFLPYIGYWQLIAAADIFLICDNFNYIKHGWISRNHILCGRGTTDITLELIKKSSNKLILDTFIVNNSSVIEKNKRKIYYEYHNAPYFDKGYDLYNKIVSYPDTNLASFLENSIRVVCEYLGINTELRKTSELKPYGNLKKQERIYVDCEQLSASTYINSIGGVGLYDKREFAEHGISLKFLKSDLPQYKQFGDEFIPSLSILDAIMFCSKKQLQKMLCCYTLI